MRISKKWAPLFALLAFSCKSGVTDIQPIVIDLSAAKTPSPAATSTLPPTPTPSPERAAAAPREAPAPRTELPAAARQGSESTRAPADVAQSRVEAYNRRDLDTLVALYAADARLYDPPDRLRDSGIEQIRQTYARRFASAPHAKISVAQRMTEGNFVVDREIETGAAPQQESTVVISEVRDGKIVRVWTLR